MGQQYHQEAAQQDLTAEDEDQERGGVIFTGPTARRPNVASTEMPKAAPAPERPQPKPAARQEHPVWQQVAAETQKKTEEAAKKLAKGLRFDFGKNRPEPPQQQ